MKNVTYINAGAGSGKTHTLTNTLTDLIKNHAVKPEQVILTTFTTKAANEFKEKAKAFLYKENLYDEAARLDQAMIGTVHSVCQRMISKYWFNLGLAPDMSVMAEEDTTYYISQSLAELPTKEELKQLHEFCRYFDIRIYEEYLPYGLDYDFWQSQLKKIVSFTTNYELDGYDRSEAESLAFIRKFVRESNCDFSYEELRAVIDEHEAFLRSCKQSATNDNRIGTLLNAKRNIHKPSIATLKEINSTIGTPKKYGPLAVSFQERMVDIWSSKMVYDKQEQHIHLMFDLAKRWKDNFTRFKQEKNLLDYDDMEKYMRQLMKDEEIANEISKSYRYLFVDEFQDSSPIQVKIFDFLSDLMKHSYWVGDYKQAIYGFRGSDIALTKAVVDWVTKKENGCDTRTLDTSYRSLPDIVEINNDVFTKTFANVLDYDNIHLKQYRKNETEEISLRYFMNKEEIGVAHHVAKLLRDGAKPNEIAVLARTNATLVQVAVELKETFGISTSREEISVVDSLSCVLVESLLRIINNSSDNLAKATVAMLTQKGFSTKELIEQKLLNDSNVEIKEADYFSGIPLIKQLLAIKPVLQQQSVAAMIESMIIELNLFNVVKKVEDSAFGASCLRTIINTAKVYEGHCVQMNLPATIDGYIAYLEDVQPKGSGDVEGVQLHTYHSCKGLQWRYVILMSLNSNLSDVKRTVKNEIYGVHFAHSEEPTAKNPYPEVYIRLTPWVYGTAKNVPDEIEQQIENSDAFKVAYKSMMDETNRVLYVGMTRPKDVLILSIEPVSDRSNTTLLKWFRDEGMNEAASSEPSGDWDALGTGRLFFDYTLTDEDLDAKLYGDENGTKDMQLVIKEPSFETLPPRYISPSKIHTKGDALSFFDFEKRISFGNQPSDMTTVGECIHQIFAAIEESSPAKIDFHETIQRYGLKGVLTNPNEIIDAWTRLVTYLRDKHGSPVKTYHERPFRLERDGQIIVGSIDFVWQTEEGDILVDFKTCPMSVKAVLDSESEHYAGWYAGQLDAYTDALEAAGEKVLKRYIYYPVSGLLTEVNSFFNI